MANGWLIALGLFAAYLGFVVWLIRTGRLQKWNLALLLGIILMIRTQKGKRALDVLARPRRFWNAFADTGIVVTLLGMALMTFLMLAAIPVVLDPANAIPAVGADEILAIPGVNPILPLWYGLIGLIVALIVHEGGHGVLARANGLKVKSMGLLYAVVPVGAFVEPDEDEMKAAGRRKRLRVSSVGPFVNIVFAVMLLGVFSVMAEGLEPVDGAPLQAVVVDGPAHAGDLRGTDIIVSATHQGATVAIGDWQALSRYLDGREPGDQVRFATRDGASHDVTLQSNWDRLDETARQDVLSEREGWRAQCPDDASGAACASRLQEDAYLGIYFFRAEHWKNVLADPAGGGVVAWWLPIPFNFLAHFDLPLQEIRGFPVLSTLDDFYTNPWSGSSFEGAYVVILLVLFWVFWLNLLVGLFNILPMLPLDGGHIFRDAVGALVDRVRPKAELEARERVAGKAAVAASFIILGALLIQILGPRFI